MPIIDLNQGIPNKVNKSNTKKADIKNTFNEISAYYDTNPNIAPVGNLFPTDSKYDEGMYDEALSDIRGYRTNKQPWYEQSGAMLNQAVVGEIIGGTLMSVGALLEAPEMVYNEFMDKDNEFHNTVFDIGKGMSDWSQEATPIYDTGERFNDPGYWFKNGVSVASSLSMLIPGMGAAKGAQLIGKGAGKGLTKLIGREIALGTTASGLLQTGMGALAMRHAENYREASGVYDSIYQQGMQALSEGKLPDMQTEDDVKKAASQAAALDYNANYVNLAFDMIQLGAILKPLGNFTRNVGLLDYKLAKAAGKLPTSKLGKAAYWMAEPGKGLLEQSTEGIEEVINTISQFEGEREGKIKLGLTPDDNTTLSDRIGGYLGKEETMDSFIWGVLGGVTFNALGKPVSKALGLQQDNTTERKLSEIANRENTIKQYSQHVNAINTGEVVRDIDGSILADYSQTTDEDKTTLVNDLRSKMAFKLGLDASKAGNVDLLLEQLDDKDFQNTLTGTGLASKETLVQDIKAVKDEVIRAEETYKKHYQRLFEKPIDQNIKNRLLNKAIILDNRRYDALESIKQLESDYNNLYQKDGFIQSNPDKASIDLTIYQEGLAVALMDLNEHLQEAKKTGNTYAEEKINRVISNIEKKLKTIGNKTPIDPSYIDRRLGQNIAQQEIHKEWVNIYSEDLSNIDKKQSIEKASNEIKDAKNVIKDALSKSQRDNEELAKEERLIKQEEALYPEEVVLEDDFSIDLEIQELQKQSKSKETPIEPEIKIATEVNNAGSNKSDVEAKIAEVEEIRRVSLGDEVRNDDESIKKGRENTRLLFSKIKQKFSPRTSSGIIIRILEKLIDINSYSTIIDDEYLSGNDTLGQATWFGMNIKSRVFEGILNGDSSLMGVFIHELIHSVVSDKISDYSIEAKQLIPGFKSKLTNKEKNAIAQLQRIFEKVKNTVPDNGDYGFTNLDEFLAEAFSNSSFQHVLAGVKSEGKKSNLFSDFVNAVGDLLYAQMEKWAKRFNKEIPPRDSFDGILQDVVAWTEDLIDENHKITHAATIDEINAKYDSIISELTNPQPNEGISLGTKVNDEARQLLNQLGYKDSQIDELSVDDRKNILTKGIPKEEWDVLNKYKQELKNEDDTKIISDDNYYDNAKAKVVESSLDEIVDDLKNSNGAKSVDSDGSIVYENSKIESGHNALGHQDRAYKREEVTVAGVKSVRYTDEDNTLNEEAPLDLLNPDKYKVGEQVEFVVDDTDDIKIYDPSKEGKEVITWGAYKKLLQKKTRGGSGRPENKSDAEKLADVEKRKREVLKRQNKVDEYINSKFKADERDRRVADGLLRRAKQDLRTAELFLTDNLAWEKRRINDLRDNALVENMKSGSESDENKLKRKNSKEEINAKYDEELRVLEADVSDITKLQEYKNNVPIRISGINAYLHSDSWITEENVTGNIQDDKLALRKIRNGIIEKGHYKTDITNVSNGVLFLLANNESHSLKEAVGNDSEYTFAVGTSDGLKVGEGKLFEQPVINKKIISGASYIIVKTPAGNNIAISTNSQKIGDSANSEDIKKLIARAINTFLDNDVASSKDILKITGFDVTDLNGLENFLKAYLHLYNTNGKMLGEIIKSIPNKTTNMYFSVNKGVIEFFDGDLSRGGGKVYFMSKDNQAQREMFLSKLEKSLDGFYLNSNIDYFDRNKNIPIFDGDNLIAKPYREFIMENLKTRVKGNKIGEKNGKDVYSYSLQPVYRFDFSEFLGEDTVEGEVKKEETSIIEGIDIPSKTSSSELSDDTLNLLDSFGNWSDLPYVPNANVVENLSKEAKDSHLKC